MAIAKIPPFTWICLEIEKKLVPLVIHVLPFTLADRLLQTSSVIKAPVELTLYLRDVAAKNGSRLMPSRCLITAESIPAAASIVAVRSMMIAG